MDLAVAALENTLAEYQDKSEVELSAEHVYQALSKLEGYENLGGLMEIDFSGGLRTPTEMRVWKYGPGGELEPVSELLPVVEVKQ